MANEIVTTVSASRRTELPLLISLLKGDLDWIVMKALDKDRSRRYPTAAAIADDVARFLYDAPVEARPPSTLYRFSKFARRNRIALTTGAIVAITLVAATAISVWHAGVAYHALGQARRAEAAANSSQAELEEFTDRLKEANQLLTSGRAALNSGSVAEAHTLYTQATKVQPRYFHVWLERGALYTRIGLWDQAASDYRTAMQLGCSMDGAEFWGVPQLFHFVGDEATQQKIAAALLKSERVTIEAKLRGLLSGEISTETATKLAIEAEHLLNSSTHDRHKNSWMPSGAKMYVAGWAQLKAEQYDRAIERLARIIHEGFLKSGFCK